MSMYGYDMPGSQGPATEPQPSATVTSGSPGTPVADPTAVIGRRTVAWLIDAVLLTLIVFFFSPFGPFAEYENISAVREEVPELADIPNDEACSLIEQEVDDVFCLVVSVNGDDRAYYVRNEIQILGSLATLAWFVLVYVIWQGATGATPGKALLKVRVVDETDGPPGLGRSLVRSLLWAVDGQPLGIPAVGFITGLTSTGHRRVGDMAAKTYVVGVDSTGRQITIPGAQASSAMPPPPPSSGPVAAPARPAPPTQTGPAAPPTSTATFTPPATAAPAPPSGEQPAQAPSSPFEAPAAPLPPPPVTAAPEEPADSPSPFSPPATPEPAETREPEPTAGPAAQSTDTRPAPPTQAEPEPRPEPPAKPEPPAMPEPEAEPEPEPEPEAEPTPEPAAQSTETPPAPPTQAEPEPRPEPPAEPEPQPQAQPEPQAQPVYQPQWDEARGTYIQWDPNRSRWLQWDDNVKEWQAI